MIPFCPSLRKAEPLEAIAMELTGQLAERYDILYSVLQDNQWTDWMKNGEEAGAYGVGLPIQGIRISVAKKLADGNSYAGNIDPTKPMIALTYDDGPSSESTARILAKLKEYEVGQRSSWSVVRSQKIWMSSSRWLPRAVRSETTPMTMSQ